MTEAGDVTPELPKGVPVALALGVRETIERLQERVDAMQGRTEALAAAVIEKEATREHMTTGPSREEIDAKLQLAEARTETRFVELNGKLDRVLDAVARSDERVGDLKVEVAGVRVDNRNTRWTIIITVVTSVLAALAAIWTTQGDLLSAFQAGLGKAQQASSPSPAAQPGLQQNGVASPSKP